MTRNALRPGSCDRNESALHELELTNASTTVMTDYLRQTKVLYSRRAAQEVRMRRKLGFLQHLTVNEQVAVRIVGASKMIADELTKSERNAGEQV